MRSLTGCGPCRNAAERRQHHRRIIASATASEALCGVLTGAVTASGRKELQRLISVADAFAHPKGSRDAVACFCQRF